MVQEEVFDAWKCSSCLYVKREADFKVEGGHLCPLCESEDVFPYRLFRHKGCGHVADQEKWFPDFSLDDNPLEEGIPAARCEECDEQDDFMDAPESADVELVPTPILD